MSKDQTKVLGRQTYQADSCKQLYVVFQYL